MWYILFVVVGLLFLTPFKPATTIMLLSMIFIGLSDPTAKKAPIRYNDIVRVTRPILVVVIFVLYWFTRKSLIADLGVPYEDLKYVDIACMVLWAYMVIVEIFVFIKYKDL